MTRHAYKIYISSTYSDLKKERNAAAEAVRQLEHTAVIMEDYTATEQKPLDKCLEDVRGCDIYIGIIAYRYGFIPEGYQKSITHLEYEEAHNQGIPRLLFMIGDEAPWPKKKHDEDSVKISAFRKTISREHTISILKDGAELPLKVTAALSNEIKELENKTRKKEGGVRVRALRPECGIPLILPYLGNRGKQRDKLINALPKSQKAHHFKPLIGVIHGDERECHDKFIENLQDYMLPEMLNMPRGVNSVEKQIIKWPDSSGQVNKRYKSLKHEVALAITKNYEADAQKIVAALNLRLNPLMLYSTIHTEGWRENDRELITRWLKYWNDLPELAVGKKLFLFLCVKYKNIDEETLFRKWKYGKINNKIRGFLDGLEKKFDEYKNINVFKFPLLNRIEYSMLDNWFVDCASNYCDDEFLRRKVENFYKEQNMKPVCMNILAVRLKKLCAETRL